jgi:hypothetical protein
MTGYNQPVGKDDIGLLPAFTIATLFVFYLVWAAMHDIAHANEFLSLRRTTGARAHSSPAFD